MKFVYPQYQMEIDEVEQHIIVLSIENSKAYRDILSDLCNQIEGLEGEVIISEKERIIKISKEVELIFNPFSLDCNNKKVITRLHQELKDQMNENLIEETAKINQSILEYLEKVIYQVPYALDYNVDFDAMNLLKMYEVKVDNLAEDLLEKIVEYVKAMNRICNMRIFVFVGLKQYLTENELEQLYEFIFYEHIYLIILEPKFTKVLNGEKSCILDSDLCIIEP